MNVGLIPSPDSALVPKVSVTDERTELLSIDVMLDGRAVRVNVAIVTPRCLGRLERLRRRCSNGTSIGGRFAVNLLVAEEGLGPLRRKDRYAEGDKYVRKDRQGDTK